MTTVNKTPTTSPQPLETDVEAALPPRPRASRTKAYAWATAGLLLGGGGAAAAIIATRKTNKSTPVPPQPKAPAPAPAPAPALAPAPVAAPNNNATGFLNINPFTMAENTAMYVSNPASGGQKYAIVLTDANETCATLTAGPVRSAGIQELDLCQVVNGSTITAQNGRIIQNGQQFQSSAVSINGTVANNRMLTGTFSLNTTNAGFVHGNFSAQPCDTMIFTNFCDLQN